MNTAGPTSRSLSFPASRRSFAAVATVALLIAAPGIGLASAAPAHATVSDALRRVTPSPSLPSTAHRLGAVASSQEVSGLVALKPRNADVMKAMLDEISIKGSPSYHDYLPAGAFARAFGASPDTVSAVRSVLTSSGMAVTSVSSNRLYIGFRGTARQAASAFHTSIDNVKLANGKTVYTATTALSLPASIATAVQGVVGLTNAITAHPALMSRPDLTPRRGAHGHSPMVSPRIASGGPAACPEAAGTASAMGGLTDTQIANAYGVNRLYGAGDTGVGQTVALFELEPYLRSDIRTFDKCYFGASATAMMGRLHNVAVDGGQQTGTGEGEASLDVDDVSAIAPGANIDVYEAPDNDLGTIDEYSQMMDDDTAKVISTSWGDCDALIQSLNPAQFAVENQIFEQGALQGQTVLSAAGDWGTDDCAGFGTPPASPILGSDDPTNQPYVVGVGGTTITRAGKRPVEHVWNDGYQWGAGGGGISATWSEPAWQVPCEKGQTTGCIPGLNDAAVIRKAVKQAAVLNEPNDFCSADVMGCREEPDVSAQADEFTGAITVVFDGQYYTTGGTSSAAPLWAGILTEINASAGCTAHPTGFVAPELYAVASVPSEYAASFNDVTKGNNDMEGLTDGLYPAKRGYDMASGLGSPEVTGPKGAKGLAYYLCAAANVTAPRVTDVSPAAVPLGGSTQITITGTGFESGAGPASDVAGIQIGNYSVPTADYTVDSASSITITTDPTSAELAAVGSGNDAGGDYDVTVVLTGGATSTPTAGTSRLAVYDTHDGADLPVVDLVGESGGPEAGGQSVKIFGAGFQAAGADTPTVTFGGVAAANVTVASDNVITATTPAYSNAVTCLNGEDPTTDVCQVQVVVTDSNGSSTTDTTKILPQYEGPVASEPVAGYESFPAPTEFDYLPTPRIDSSTLTSVDTPGATLANEAGGDEITLTGVGLGALGFEWNDVGDPTNFFAYVYAPVFDSGTTETFVLPPDRPTKKADTQSVWVQTLASPDNGNLSKAPPYPDTTGGSVTYAPTPRVTTIDAGNKYNAGPASGGTKLTITGSGFDPNATYYVAFKDAQTPASLDLEADVRPPNFTSNTNTSITLAAPSTNAGVDDVEVCGVSGCSRPSAAARPVESHDVFTYFQDGNPVITAVSPSSAKAGKTIEITGRNLGFVRSVSFGSAKAHATNPPALLDDGNENEVLAVVPKQASGSKVTIHLSTLESRTDKVAPATASFRYRKAERWT